VVIQGFREIVSLFRVEIISLTFIAGFRGLLLYTGANTAKD